MICFRKGKPLRISPYWIKQRILPTSTYWVSQGQMLVSRAKELLKKEPKGTCSTIYHRFNTKLEYQAKIAELKAAGEKVF